MNKIDKTKIQTAITILLSQNPTGLTSAELAQEIRKLPLGIHQSRGEISGCEIAAILKTWKGFGRKSGVIKSERKGTLKVYNIIKVKS